jgi:predicted transcriptional regulator of viral defense system
MADSVYISANLSGEQLRFMKLLDELEVEYFHFGEIEAQFNLDFDNLNEVLENLVHKALLHRIERGKYKRVNFSDVHVIGTFIAKQSAIAYWSALNLHGLTAQFPNTIFVQTTQRKKSKTIQGVYYKFVTIHPRKHTGICYNGYGNYRYPITDVEKTLVDCFDLQQHSGGFDVLIRAFAGATLSASKLIDYHTAVDNVAAMKRMGFLAGFLGKSDLASFTTYAKSRVNQRYSLLDTGGPDQGEFVKEWRVRLNVSRDALYNIANEVY